MPDLNLAFKALWEWLWEPLVATPRWVLLLLCLAFLVGLIKG